MNNGDLIADLDPKLRMIWALQAQNTDSMSPTSSVMLWGQPSKRVVDSGWWQCTLVEFLGQRAWSWQGKVGCWCGQGAYEVDVVVSGHPWCFSTEKGLGEPAPFRMSRVVDLVYSYLFWMLEFEFPKRGWSKFCKPWPYFLCLKLLASVFLNFRRGAFFGKSGSPRMKEFGVRDFGRLKWVSICLDETLLLRKTWGLRFPSFLSFWELDACAIFSLPANCPLILSV